MPVHFRAGTQRVRPLVALTRCSIPPPFTSASQDALAAEPPPPPAWTPTWELLSDHLLAPSSGFEGSVRRGGSVWVRLRPGRRIKAAVGADSLVRLTQ